MNATVATKMQLFFVASCFYPIGLPTIPFSFLPNSLLLQTLTMKKTVLLCAAATLAVVSLAFRPMYSSGPAASGLDRTNRPTTSGTTGTCGTCHGGGTYGLVTSDIKVIDAGGNEITQYVPNTAYTVKLTVTSTKPAPGFGGQLVCIKGTSQNGAGSLTNQSSNAQITILNNRSYLEHSNVSATNVFSATWTAPGQGTGAVTFYASGMAVNATGGDGGDSPSAGTSLPLTEKVVATASLDASVIGFTAFPNPATSFVNLATTVSEGGAFALSVVDMQGRVVRTQPIELQAGANQTRRPPAKCQR